LQDDEIFDELSRSYETEDALQAAIRQAEQQLMNAWHAMNPKDGDHGPSNVQIMEEAWAKLTPEQQEKGLRQLFNGYWHHTKAVQAQAGIAAMARMVGSTFLEDMDLETLDFAYVSVLEGDWTNGDGQVVEVGKVSDFKDRPEETLPEMATVHVELEVVWRLIQEIKLLQFREQQRAGA
jgi:hypothetical protein